MTGILSAELEESLSRELFCKTNWKLEYIQTISDSKPGDSGIFFTTKTQNDTKKVHGKDDAF